jgi:hypothetical protein
VGGGGGATGTAGSTPTTGTTAAPTMTLSSNTSGSVVSGTPAIITATVKDATGKAAVGALVKFELADGTLATFTPSSGTRLTDANGNAAINLNAAGLTSAGATTITAKSTVTTGTTEADATAKLNFEVGPASVTLSNLVAVADTLCNGADPVTGARTCISAYATTSVTVDVGGVPTTTDVPISFDSTCATGGKATLTSTGKSSNGKATATYTDKGCNGTDQITASVTGTTTTLTQSLRVNPPSAASIQFVSATPAAIVLKGTGGVESSVITFKLVDNNSQPIASANVTLDLTTRAGGILLDSLASAVTKPTNATGEVSVSVSAGTVPTPVWVTAAHTSGGNTFKTQSNRIQISTGRPVQNRFSLSIETFNIEGLNRDGTTTSARVIASDRVGNPVPDGTAINFATSGGQVGTSSLGTCTTTNGTCSVTFTSANPRPPSGRVALVAYAVGEESFNDSNGNNVWDSGVEDFQDLGDLFVDLDFSNTYSSAVGDQRVVFGGASACGGGIAPTTRAYVPPGTVLPNMVATTCDQTWGAAHVREQITVVLSGSFARLKTPASPTLSMGTACTRSFNLTLDDGNGNILPAGTTVSVSAESSVKNPNVTSAATLSIAPGTVQNTVAVDSTHQLGVIFDATDCSAAASTGSVTILVKTPSGIETAIPLTF